MLALLIVATLTVTPALEEAPVRLASPGFAAVNVDPNLALFFSDHFAQQLTLQGIRVLTASEISAVVGFERQKDLLGCSDSSSSCMAELANALGVDGLVIGSIAKFDNTYQVNLKVVATSSAVPLAVFSSPAEGDKGMIAKLNQAAAVTAPEVLRKLGRTPAAPKPELALPPRVEAPGPRPAAGRWPLLPTVAGGLFLATGAVLEWRSIAERNAVDGDRVRDLAEARQRISLASWERGGGFAALGVGAGLLVTSYLLSRTGGDGPVAVSILPSQQGGAFTVMGVLP